MGELVFKAHNRQLAALAQIKECLAPAKHQSLFFSFPWRRSGSYQGSSKLSRKQRPLRSPDDIHETPSEPMHHTYPRSQATGRTDIAVLEK